MTTLSLAISKRNYENSTVERKRILAVSDNTTWLWLHSPINGSVKRKQIASFIFGRLNLKNFSMNQALIRSQEQTTMNTLNNCQVSFKVHAQFQPNQPLRTLTNRCCSTYDEIVIVGIIIIIILLLLLLLGMKVLPLLMLIDFCVPNYQWFVSFAVCHGKRARPQLINYCSCRS